MTINKYQPHVHVLPEDDANRQLANGFLLDPLVLINRIQVLEVAGGWNEVLEHFCSIHSLEMKRFPGRAMVLLIDLDGYLNRLQKARERIPEQLAERVFILGVLSRPEDLKQDLGSYEDIGLRMAQDCREGTDLVWGHRLLRHNSAEIDRLRRSVCSILFPQT